MTETPNADETSAEPDIWSTANETDRRLLGGEGADEVGRPESGSEGHTGETL